MPYEVAANHFSVLFILLIWFYKWVMGFIKIIPMFYGAYLFVSHISTELQRLGLKSTPADSGCNCLPLLTVLFERVSATGVFQLYAAIFNQKISLFYLPCP